MKYLLPFIHPFKERASLSRPYAIRFFDRTCLLLFMLFSLTVAATAQDIPLIEIAGKVRNEKNNKPLANANITLEGTNIATVTNSDGYFLLKIPSGLNAEFLKVDLIGFQTDHVALSERGEENLSIFLSPTGKVLEEVVVLGGDPREIIATALRKIPRNYSDKDNLFQGFYRETVQKGNRYISISEAIVDVLKKPYDERTTRGEQVSIHRGRSLMSPRSSDTLAVKLMGGPFMPIALDVVKNGDHLFTEDELDYFEFKMLPAAMIDNRVNYAISFRPKVRLSYPLHNGTFYIDSETLAISRVEFELDMKDKSKVTRSILQKKPSGLHFKPLEVSGTVTYKTVDGKSYINYISSRMRFKCDWKKRLFSSAYTSMAEMVMVDREEPEGKIKKLPDAFGQRKIFSDVLDNYTEEDFWKDYNIIEPSESLEKAAGKLKKNPLQ